LSFRWLIWGLASPSQLLLATTMVGTVLVLATSGRAGPPSRWLRIGRRLTLVGGIGLLLFGLLPVSHYLAHALEARFPVPGTAGGQAARPLPAKVDGIILLAGSERPAVSQEYGEPQTGSHGSRYITALRLAYRHPSARLVFTGGARSEPGKGTLETQAAVAAAILGQIGLDPARLVFDEWSRDTCDHPRNVQALVQPRPGETWVVVTSAMHMPRTVACFRAAGWGDVIPYPTDFKVVLGGWDAGTVQVADNLALLDAALHEWMGLAYYRLTGRTQEWFPAPAVAAAVVPVSRH
jgi:uncharacterized SAM-binding protein YcdF (DUF218 family)